jgi:hypothetical protein
MDNLHVKDVRCFRGTHLARLAPLTIVVGENSSGKSTLLSLTRIAWDIGYGVAEPNFNEEPFGLGAFDEIAHYHGGQGKRAKSFEVGFTQDLQRSPRRTSAPVNVSVVGTFTPSGGQPALTTLKVHGEFWEIQAQRDDNATKVVVSLPSKTYDFSSALTFEQLNPRALYYIIEPLRFRGLRGSQAELFGGEPPSESELEPIVQALATLRGIRPLPRKLGNWPRPLATAPIRTRPKRTYDPLQEARSPEGEHVPMLLARLTSTAPASWKKLEEDLAAYGRQSGLFEDLFVRRLGKSDSSPFQLRVKLTGQKKEVNLVDVGYGVSQVLPILVEALLEAKPTIFLLQQPEVHLHPRAQAELGTSLATLAAQRGHRFIVETHSDHIVDRVRLAARDKLVDPSMISLLFCDRSATEVRVYELSVDARGNLVGTPDGYREFFLREELRLIGG